MAQTVDQIKSDIYAYKDSLTELSVLNSLSRTAIYRAWIYLISLIVRNTQLNFDSHRADILALMAADKSHRVGWYRTKVLGFRYGCALVQDDDIYPDGMTDAEIEAAQVVKYCAVIRSGAVLKVKVAGVSSGMPSQLTPDQATAVGAYIYEVGDAGVVYEIVNLPADYFRATIDVYFDPMILSSAGARLDGSNDTPVQSAVSSYLANLKFNGEYRNTDLVDSLQSIDGVAIPELKAAQWKYGTGDWVDVNAKMNPVSGYMKIYDPSDLQLNFIAYASQD